MPQAMSHHEPRAVMLQAYTLKQSAVVRYPEAH